ncbi:hypothetical protein BGZ93_000263 [Podila epicladia]|nr:hypothetical protein BGZ92_000261 [Podila epicladia]KAG0086160.1 hypothetical protein BGZ93_000263 [Podila epicladia]
MFDVPELDNMVYMDLDRYSVVQCARVDKKWNKLASPYVFQEIPRLPKKHHQEAFRRIVLEDYLQEQGNAPGPPHGPQPTLSKYGHCVRRICNLNNILLYLKPTATKTTRAAATTRPAKTAKSTKTVQEPSADDLLCHFLTRCRNLQQDELSLTKQHFESPQKLRYMHHMTLASIRTLSISSDENSIALTAATLQQVLISVSSSLESLTLSVPLLHIESSQRTKWHQLSLIGGGDKQDLLADRWSHFQTLKILDIPPCHDNNTIKTQFWDWFWPTCSHITSLEVAAFGPSACRHLALGLEYMSHLVKVQFGRTDKQDIVDLSDHDLSTMITAASSGSGLNDVRFKSTAHAGPLAFRALLQYHYSTLEELHFVRHADSAATVALLRTCPRLRVLAALDNKDRPDIRFPEVDAKDFADWDAEARAPRPWPCAAVLETLQIKIMGAAHPLLRWDKREKRQKRVFRRLGRFVNLHVLWLGHEPKLTPVVRRMGGRPTMDFSDNDFSDSEEDFDEDEDDDEEVDDPWSERQQEGLPMTWAAGARSLEGLKKLRELNLSRMDNEFEETVAHWIVMVLPNLGTIRGLENREGQMEAYRFLKQCHPKLIRD